MSESNKKSVAKVKAVDKEEKPVVKVKAVDKAKLSIDQIS
jgi:hypothetical protein